MLRNINNIKISKNFFLKEFQSSDTKTVMIYPKLLQATQKLRDLLKTPIRITSAYRTVQHNAHIGGASKSRHLRGRAIDCYIKRRTDSQIKKTARRAGFTFIKKYKETGHYHFDIGE